MRHNTVILMLPCSTRPTQGAQSPPPCEPWLPAKLCRFAVPSVFMTVNRAASDAFPTRHWLSRRPIAHSTFMPTAA
ncbi:hypothetical protein LES60_18810 [Pectobacterium brasiliense]|nr:hypothetical protein [Pectobacterium brasiliense]MCA5933981.1 hypothetical protein [Pectobacterium brasiliense]